LGVVKHLILDVNVIVDLWLEEGSSSVTETLITEAKARGIQLWVTAATLATLDYVVRRAFKVRGVPPDAVAEMIPQLVTNLLGTVSVLSNYGFEQAEIYRRATDFEAAQTAAAARSLTGQPICVVTEDDTFDTLGEIPHKSPAEAFAWLLGHGKLKDAISFIDLASQQAALRQQIERSIETVLRHGQYIMGPEVKELEDKLTEYVGTKHCITCASGTEALLMSLMALGIKPGDEVITSPFTFIATAEVIVLLGAIPVFVDIQPGTFNLDPSKIEAAITGKTRAIMPVSLYGQPADMDEINAIAAKFGLPVIEDAAQSFGAAYKGKKSCNLSTIGCTSFFPSKPLGCYGDGGAIFTNDDALAKAMREIRIHGQEKRYYHTRIGVGGRMDTLQCAIVLAKLSRFEWEVEQREKIGARYNEQLAQIPGVVVSKIMPDRTSVYAQYTISASEREIFLQKLKDKGIPTAVHYPVPLNRQPAYQSSCRIVGALSNSDEAASRVCSLPMHPEAAAQ
jgi:UDP-2-acetamido-2-deoxy-ribo-hexuluronate aminotransferase